jgi:Zn-finger nucleic acid-binding protein
VLCPKCSAAAFEGTHFCPKCGASIEHEVVASDQTARCPRCRVDMQSVKLGAATARECPGCSGLWLEAQAFDRICGDREQRSSVLGAAGASAPPPNGIHPDDIRYLRCPSCAKLMNRVNFARISGVVIDVCKHDGVWLDAGELQRLIGFIDAGGLETARSRERERLVDEQHRLEAMRMGPGAPAQTWQETRTATVRLDDHHGAVVDAVRLLGDLLFNQR